MILLFQLAAVGDSFKCIKDCQVFLGSRATGTLKSGEIVVGKLSPGKNTLYVEKNGKTFNMNAQSFINIAEVSKKSELALNEVRAKIRSLEAQIAYIDEHAIKPPVEISGYSDTLGFFTADISPPASHRGIERPYWKKRPLLKELAVQKQKEAEILKVQRAVSGAK